MARRSTLVAIAIYLAYAIFVTWPLATDLDGQISAPSVAGDLGGAIGHAAEVVEQRLFPFAPVDLPEFDAPFGAPEPWVLNWATLPGTAMLYGLSYAFGAVAGHGIFLLLGFVLSGTAMFLLCRRLFGSVPVALLAGFVFAFHPMAIAKTEAHLHFVHGWVLVLPVWRLLEVAQAPTVRNGVLAGLAGAFAMWFTPYFILIGGVAFAVAAVAALAASAARGELRRGAAALAASGVPIVVLFGGLAVLALAAAGSGSGDVRTQPIDALYTYSARVHELVLPDRNNLIFGGATEGYLTEHLHGSNFSENSVYLGLSVLGLALLGAALAARLLWRERRAVAGDAPVVAAVTGALIAVTATAFAAPPKVGVLGVQVPTPSYAVFQVTSTWRVYSRFALLIELGLCLLLAFGLVRAGFGRPRAWRAAALGALAVVVVLDLWARPDVRTTKTTPIDAYLWLRDHPGGGVAEFPIQPASSPGYAPLFWQDFHGHPLLQGYVEGSESESRKLELRDLADEDTAPGLAALGVRYAVIPPAVLGDDPVALEGLGFALRLSRPDASVYEVTAPPARTEVDALKGFAPMEGGPGFQYRWLGEAEGVLGVFARSCRDCRGEVVFTSSSNDVARRLTIRDARDGRVLLRRRIPGTPSNTRVRVPVRLRDGRARLVLTTDVPPRRPAAG
ncbi:MAG TPA: hypothetical protein VD931_03505, partial [Baekduia sp.]|nr:hypothetical protein [Baekduia sp.]